ncbi:phenylacetate-CoA ligase [Desulfohalotomaculum tongense]|uniref:phenylacetate--CoA ligase family protein n=1 Tax=Desulforadius tongensis TaxID=1216062 RepID=UPI0019591AC2|nr:phenylacetate--CoA ligase [Desulforadius tongensis]MBM7853770.1 phenylacetate-CoA ligase [Desulforadius tongensis]
MIWDVEKETMSRSRMQAIQLERLQQTLKNVYENVSFYRQKFDQYGVKPEHCRSLKDLSRFPFTVKTDLRENYPFNMFAVPKKKIVRIHASSGTTGKPTVVGYTKNDLNTWAELVARMVTMAGVSSDDVAQVCFGYGLFTGAFGLHYGLERVGAMVVPTSTGNTERQIMLMQDFETTAVISTPTYAMHMAEVARKMGVDPARLPIRVGLFGSEAWTENMRAEIEKTWHIKATDNYGLSEIMGPGVAGECLETCGMHIAEDHFLVEVIDPETGEPLDYGQEGELVITSLTKEALPIIRYRTRDITALNPEPCRCGRTTIRMKKVSGRTDDMLIISGVNVFPSQIESVLLEIDGISSHYQIIVTKKGYLDALEVQVEPAEKSFTGHFKDLKELEEKVKNRLAAVLSLRAKVKLVEPGSLERFEGKAKRVIDKRKM